MEVLEIIIKAFSSLVVLFLLSKLMGKKQISQLNYFDYIIGISIGSIAAQMSLDLDLPFYIPIISMCVYALCAVFISYITSKSIKARRFLYGEPTVIVYHGQLYKQGLKKCNMDINDFLTECRCKNFFNLADIEFAIVECNGKISIQSKSNKVPITPYDVSLKVPQQQLYANVIIDGKIMAHNLLSIGFDKNWILSKLKELGISDASKVFLGICDNTGDLTIYNCIEDAHKGNLFI